METQIPMLRRLWRQRCWCLEQAWMFFATHVAIRDKFWNSNHDIHSYMRVTWLTESDTGEHRCNSQQCLFPTESSRFWPFTKGMAGITVAKRLKEEGVNGVVVVEGSDRVGGYFSWIQIIWKIIQCCSSRLGGVNFSEVQFKVYFSCLQIIRKIIQSGSSRLVGGSKMCNLEG